MPKNESVEFFLRFLRERFDAFRKALSGFLQALALDDRPKKLEHAKAVRAALDDLRRALSERDHPPWLGQLDAAISSYVTNIASTPKAGLQLLNTIMDLYPRIESQQWDFADSSSNAAVDFTAVYTEFYRESRVPELFDELVEELNRIVDSGEVDSLQAIKSLERLIATIKRNARGDFFSTRGAWEFAQVFMRNYGWELLESTPGIKQAVKALRKTMTELDLEFNQVHEQIRAKLSTEIVDEIPMLEYRVLALPAPEADTKLKVAEG